MKSISLILLLSLFLTGYSYSQCSNPYVGQDTAFCGNTGDLSVENATSGYWIANVLEGDLSAVIEFYPSSTSEDISIITSGSNVIFEFIWIDESGPCNDTVLVEFVEQPQAYAGQDFDVCGGCGELNASGEAMSMSWLANGSVFSDYNSPQTGVCYSSYGDVLYTWLITNNSSITSVQCSDQDTVNVTFWREPTANILTDFEDSVVCGLSFNHLYAENPGSGVTGHWECPTCGPTWENPIVPPIVEVSNYGMHVFYWIEETGPSLTPGFCTDTDGPLIIHFIDEQPLYAGYDEDAFGFEHTLHGFSGAENDQFSECIYLWENEDAIIEDATSLETAVTVPEYGAYEFILSSYYTNLDDCVDSDTVKITFIDPIYMSDQNLEVSPFIVDVFPNPANDIITIRSESEISNVYIYDVNGRLVLSSNEKNSTIDVSELDSGVYFINVQSDKINRTFKLVIK